MCECVVIGYNPENADYTNPRGAIYRIQASIVVEAPDGSRWAHYQTRQGHTVSDAEAKVQRLVDNVNAHIQKGGQLDASYWNPVRPAYMSEAYARGGFEQEKCALERMQDMGY